MMVEADQVENIEFKWGKRRGIGGKKKEVQFYESFTFDGVEYALFDSVYLYKEDEPEPYIGMLIKIWEHPDKTKKVKLLWFFRPCEILNYLGDEEMPGNEIFLASGEGVGLANVNPLEAIAGKCSVVCISKDSRNPQPSDEEIQMADFIFYRTFDVAHRKILDGIDEKIAGIDIKFLFNKLHPKESSGVLKLYSEKEEAIGSVVAKTKPSKQNLSKLSKEDKTLKRDENCSDSLSKFNADLDASLGQKNPSLKLYTGAGVEVSKMAKTSDKEENICAVEATSRSRVDSNVNGSKVGRIPVKSNKDPGQSDDRLSEKSIFVSDGKDTKSVVPTVTASGDKSKRKLVKDSYVSDQGASKKVKLDEKVTEPAKKTKVSHKESSNEINKTDEVIEVTRRPDADRSKWFRGLPWEERMQTADKQGTLVLLQNLDPSYTSGEVEDIVWHGFKESCTAKMIQKTAFSSPHSGQAFVIFKTREAAELVVKKLEEGCLNLSNGRPLVGSLANPCFRGKQSTFYGHLVIDKIKVQMQREMKQAISTSHCSQPNTIEYEMALEWCLLQETSDISWKKLYKRQGEELRKLKDSFKSK